MKESTSHMSASITWAKDNRRILDSIADERAAKVRSLRTEIPLLRDEFSKTSADHSVDSSYLDGCIDFAMGLTYTKSSLGTSYLSHPLRVAQYILRVLPLVSQEYVAVALLHNVPETSAATLDDLETRFGKNVAAGVGTLLVDRTVPFETIIEAYYARLFAAGSELTLIKVFDKFDNLLVLGANANPTVRSTYMNEVRRKLVPWCLAFDRGLGSYLEQLLVETEERGYDEELNALVQAAKRKGSQNS